MKGKCLTDDRNCLRLVDHQPCHSVGLFIGKAPICGAVEITNGHCPINQEMPIGARFQLRRFIHIKFIGDFTHNLLKDIFKRDQAAQSAVFVHHQREMRFAAQELAHLFVQCGGVRHEIGFHGHIGDTEIFDPLRVFTARQPIHGAQQILCMDHANDIFRLAAIDGQAGMGGLQGLAQDFLRGGISIDHFDL